MQHKRRWHIPDAIVVHHWALTTEELHRVHNPREVLSPPSVMGRVSALRDSQLTEMAVALGTPKAHLADRALVRERILRAFESGQLVALRSPLPKPQEQPIARSATSDGVPTGQLPSAVPPPQMLAGADVLQFGRVKEVTPYLAMREAPSRSAREVKQLRFNDRVFVLKKLPESYPGWSMVVADDGTLGFIDDQWIFLNPPEPDAKLYKVVRDDSPDAIAREAYKGSITKIYNQRFYINAIEFANRDDTGRRKGIYKPAENDGWRYTKLREGFYIWIPSTAFAQSLRDKVSTGSLTIEVWEAVCDVASSVWEWTKFGVGFLGGIIHGAFASLWDIVTGLVDLVGLLWDLIKGIITGSIFPAARKLWDELTWENVKQAVSEYFGEVKAKWNDESSLKRGHYRGYVIGYLIAEIVVAFFTFGGVTAAKWTGRLSKVVELFKRIRPLAKVLEEAEAFAKRADKAYVEAKKLLKLRRLNKGLQKALGEKLAMKLIAEAGEEAVQELLETMGEKLVKEFGEDLTHAAMKQLAKNPGAKALEELGASIVKKLLREGMSHEELAEWAAKLGTKGLRHWAAKLDFATLRHYGVLFYQRFKGITQETMKHLLEGAVKKGKISGAHDSKAFLKLLAKNGGQVITSWSDARFPKVRKFLCQLPGGPKFTKTVITDLAKDWVKWEERANEAILDAMRTRKFPQPPATGAHTGDWLGKSLENLPFKGYFGHPPDVIDTFFILM